MQPTIALKVFGIYLPNRKMTPFDFDFDVIVACDVDNGGGIGFRGSIPWHVKEDMQRFRAITTDAPKNGKRNAVIMGEKTWTSFPVPNDALPGRFKIILSKTFAHYDTINVNLREHVFVTSLDAALELARSMGDVHKIFVIGGTRVYREAIEHPQCGVIHFTRIYRSHEYTYDAYFPFDRMKELTFAEHDVGELKTTPDGSVHYQFSTWSRYV